jgi:hypothetical protein
LFQDFNPRDVPWQFDAIKYIDAFDYSKGVLEVLLSGSVGSAKSILAAHLILRHAIENPQARVLVVRRALKDLKRTIWSTILKHAADIPQVIRSYNKSEMKITLINGSEIIGDSYDDMNLEKFRSLELSMAVIEEASESEKEVYDAIKMRVGRAINIKQNLIIAITNPDSPSHYLYKEFIESESPNKKVFYSLTEHNKFLPKWYIDNLKRDLDPKLARRMLYGEWVEITTENIYHAYNPDRNFLKNQSYEIKPRPIMISFDFNIGLGKPMSCAVMQYDSNVFHVFREVIVHGARTENIMEELDNLGLFNLKVPIHIYGDATGAARTTKSLHTDYDVITNYLKRHKEKPTFVLKVPRDNPPIRERHNVVNKYCLNENGEVRLLIYKDAPTADKALRFTTFKKGGHLVEDDSKDYQHIGTAIGYALVYEDRLFRMNGVQVSLESR